MEVVVVESPAKAKTVGRYLGRGYRVLACYGHVSDLPAKAGSVKPDEDFAMVYETAGRRAARALGAIRAALEEAGGLVLATDPDREGEAIAWQVLTWLHGKDALADRPVRRVAFHEITAEAVREAMAHPRAVDMDLVRAQQARRALDYLVGFGLSPVLWRKVPGCRSAGRVQSVALRLVCEREADIESFEPRARWTVEVGVEAEGGAFAARPVRLDGAPLDPLALASRKAADEAARRIREAAFTVEGVERAHVRRRPAPPFTTSTLQQEASRKLGFSGRRTMEIAQALYEGIDLGGERAGIITYLRTDGVVISAAAVRAARQSVLEAFGEHYLPRKPRVYRSRARNAQEAHEAIRPTDFSRTPETLGPRLGGDVARLYALIRNRALASQMASACFDQVEVRLASVRGDIVLAAGGSAMAFDGFLRLYCEGAGEAGAPESERTLPALEAGQTVRIGAVRVERQVSAPPARYTEAGLVRRLEELGIGRPSTYAAIVGVLQEREYVALVHRRFVPLERGRVVTAFLEGFFAPWVEYGFTARMEEDLDRIAGGALVWKGMLRGFWGGFHAALEQARGLERATVLAALEAGLDTFLYGRGERAERRRCPACGEDTLGLKASRYGPFVGCLRWPECGYRRPLAAGSGGEYDDYTGPRPLGADPGSGLAVTLRRGPNGWYIQSGEGGGGAKPARVSVPGAMVPDAITLDVALRLLALPREVGAHPESGEPILAGIGRYGPWLRHAETYVAIPDDDDVLAIGLNRAVHLVTEKEVRESRARGPKQMLRALGRHPGDGAPVWLKTGHYGPFVAHRRRYASVPKDVSPGALTLEQALELLEREGGGGRSGPARTRR